MAMKIHLYGAGAATRRRCYGGRALGIDAHAPQPQEL
jgi:hypothetical protein